MDPDRAARAQRAPCGAVEAPAPHHLDGLLARFRGGDGTAFGEVYRSFARVVHGVVLAAVGPQEAEDLTQEVFVKIHDGLADVRDAAALPGWICTIARNAAIDHGRRLSRRPAALHLDEEPAREDGPVEDRELGERVLALIRGLPASYRETLVLRLVEGLTGPEIAERTGMTHGSVRVNLTRGMALLRPLLRKEGWS